jgi:methyl-accepting chemotaxis protein
MSFTNLKVGARMGIGFGSVCVLLLIIIGIGLSKLSVLDAGTSNITKNTWPKISMVSEVIAQTDGIAISLRNMMLSDDAADKQKQIDIIQSRKVSTKENISKLQNMITESKERELFQQIVDVQEKYVAGQNKLLELINSAQSAEAKTYLNNALRPVLASYKDALNNMIRYQVESIETAARTASDTYASARSMMLALGAAALLLAAAIGLLITRGLLAQLGGEPAYARGIAEKIAAGDLTITVDTKANDRSSLLFAMKSMRDSLAQVVGQVRSGTDTIATASSEIAAGNLDLSSRTEQQASSLEETASSMEELTSTVKQNADNARQANQLAVSASDVAIKGGAVVSQVVDTMSSINDSSKKIVDIIGVIDGIAFQTNILALNAAVEAARAGEQGRGFAVVASEVRSLAQRSAAAAKEIKTLIGDSVEKVDVGTKLVGQAGSTMQEIVESVKRVTDVMSEITAASLEQTSGIEQINQAIAQMDEVTQQNAALVEQAAAAAASLQDQAGNLAQVVSVFKLDDAGAAAVTETRVMTQKAASVIRSARKAQPALAVRTDARRGAAPARRLAAVKAEVATDWEEF